MTQRFLFEELDGASQDYLQKVREREGNGFVGVYVASSNWLPLVGFFVGLVVIGATLWFTIPPLGDPMKATMLQVAGLLLGGWLVVAAMRVWTAVGSRHYLGHFVFADPLHLWEASGPVVQATALDTLVSAGGIDKFKEGAYVHTRVTLNLGKRQHAFTVKNLQKASDLISFCSALAELRSEGGSGQQTSPVVLGQRAMSLLGLVLGGENLDAGQVDDYSPTPGSQYASTPALPTPTRAAQPRSGWRAYAVIVVLAVGGVLGLRPVNTAWHDHAWFNFVKDKDPPELRAYLLDPVNTRHRDEVAKRLAEFYEPIKERVQKAGADRALGPEFIALVDDLKVALQPLVSLHVKEETRDQGGAEFERMQNIERRLTDLLYNAFTITARDGRQVPGNKLVDTVKPPDGAKPILEVIYRFDPIPNQPNALELKWTVNLRHKVSKEAVATSSWTVGTFRPDQLHDVEKAILQTMAKLTGREDWNL